MMRTSHIRGQVLILFAVILLVIAGICVLTIDFGRICVCKSELQNAVDSAALAGASQLITYMTEEEKADAVEEAKALALANKVDNVPLTLGDEDIKFGHYISATGEFIPEPQTTIIDSMRVTGSRTTTSPNGPIYLFFGPIFGFDEVGIRDVVAVGTKPRRFAMFVLDRSGSMCFDTTGITLRTSPESDATGYYMSKSTSGWYALPQQMYYSSSWRTAYFWGRDDATGAVRTDFLPDHIKSTLVSGQYWYYRTPDGTGNNPSWLKVPSNVTIYGRYSTSNWSCSNYYSVPGSCDYAISSSPVQPLQSVMDAACAFVGLLRPEDDRAGLVTYASGKCTDSTLTDDFASLETKLQTFSPCGATAEPEGMDSGLDELIDSGRAEGYGQRLMILLTDGNANILNGTNYANGTTRTFDFLGHSVTTKIHPTIAAAMATQVQRAKAGSVRIYCVTFGADCDTAIHSRISAETGGAYYYSADHEDLTAIFVDIFRRLPPLLTK